MAEKKNILVRPIITEKAEMLTEERNQYSFVVHHEANKIEIAKAVEEMYNVEVAAVNTAIMPGKRKNRNTRSGLLQGRIPSYKKAIVTVANDEEIDFFGDI